jgi:hypothetical protein
MYLVDHAREDGGRRLIEAHNHVHCAAPLNLTARDVHHVRLARIVSPSDGINNADY